MSHILIVWLLFIFSRSLAVEDIDLRCRECGSVLSNLKNVLDDEADDSDGRYKDASIQTDYGLFYDTFPEHKGQERSKLYYFSDINETNVVFLPTKIASTHFEGYTFQNVICRRCKQTVGYIFSPETSAQSVSKSDGALSLLDFCPYTHCWDVHEQILRTLEEVNIVTFQNGKSMFSLTPELAITNQTILSNFAFDISLLSVFGDNATSVFGYDYSSATPEPFYSFYLPQGNGTIHIDITDLNPDSPAVIEMNIGEGSGLTELRFRYCPWVIEPIKFHSMECISEYNPFCRFELCVGSLAIPQGRPEGSFFALHADGVVVDDETFAQQIESIDLPFL